MNTEYQTFLNLCQERRSIRHYTSQPIPHKTIEDILKIGALAPSSYGQNPVEFFVIEGRENLDSLADCKAMGAPSVRNAQVAVVVAADTDKGELWVEDASVAAENILLAAQSLGIGACWNQIHLRKGQHTSASREICSLIGIPSRYEVLCIISLGFPAEQKSPRNAEKMSENRIHFIAN
ncbi:MAG: nitroreductase family protein [Muribaculaceae bacterium]|nr:nitroreductase family protein [Muribaculaceae bacterium]